MKFKINEKLSIQAADLLREAGYDAAIVWEQHLEGMPDSDIASVCREERRVLIR